MRIGRHCCWQLGLILGHGVGSWADCRACEKHWNRGECGVAPQAGHAALASRACLFSALHCRVRWSGAPTLVQPHCDVKFYLLFYASAWRSSQNVDTDALDETSIKDRRTSLRIPRVSRLMVQAQASGDAVHLCTVKRSSQFTSPGMPCLHNFTPQRRRSHS